MSFVKKEVSIVIPIFNEAERLDTAFGIIKKWSKQYPEWQWIFVDDGSEDNSKVKVQKSKLRNRELVSYKQNRGKGFALKQGVMQVKTKYVLITDVDFSTPLDQLELFVPFINQGADIVTGTRKVKGARVTKHQKAFREWMGKRFTTLCNLWLGLDTSDYTCGFKLFETTVAKKLFGKQQIERWGYDAELIFLAHKYGYRVVEVPVTWENDERTKVNLEKDILGSLGELVRIRWYDWTKRYN